MILFYQWNAFMQKGMEKALKKLKIEYEVYYDIADNWDKDDAFERRFTNSLHILNLIPECLQQQRQFLLPGNIFLFR